jgi:hypothetical protein
MAEAQHDDTDAILRDLSELAEHARRVEQDARSRILRRMAKTPEIVARAKEAEEAARLGELYLIQRRLTNSMPGESSG